MAEAYQLYGPDWTAAVNAGTVPPQVIGSFGLHPSPAQLDYAGWLNGDALYTGGKASGNNEPMQRLEALAFAYVTPNFMTTYYQNSDTEQRIVAALDSYSFMQALNGCYGNMTAWDGVGATTPSSGNPYGRQNAQCNPIEGQGTWALGAAILQMQGDSSFRTALNQPINSTLEPGVLRYQAYQTMLVNHINFLLVRGHGHAPNQDLLAARAYVYANLALRALDAIYGTGLARSNAQMYSDYLNETAGIVPNANSGLWISNGGLGLEVNGNLNGGFDGGYGWLNVTYLMDIAKILKDNGIENATSHPVRTVAINASHAFSNFIYPSLAVSGSAYETTMRSEQFLTFRHDGNVGPIATLRLYCDAAEFNDPYALHGFYLEHANGITWGLFPNFGGGHTDSYLVSLMQQYADYVTLGNMLNAQPDDPTGVTFLNEPAHADGVWADPTGSTIAIKHAGDQLRMVLNWRPLATPGEKVALSPTEPMNNVARVHDTTATMDRLATIDMPSSAATGASGNYKSGTVATLYIARYGNYLVGLNWETSAVTMALPPDMQTTGGTATDLASGVNYDLTRTTSVPVPASGAVALFQSMPTSNLSASSIDFGSVVTGSSSSPQTLTVTNSGTGPLLIGTTSITSTNASDFTYTTTCSATLAANASCRFTFTFTPQSTGARSATFNLKTSVSSNAQTIALTGTGAAPAPAPAPVTPSLTLTPAPGNVSLAAGGSTTVQLTLTPGGRLAGTVTLSCSSPQSFITCSLPSSATVGSSPSNVTVSITAASTVAYNQPSQPQSSFSQQAALAVLSGGLALLFPRRFRRLAAFAPLTLATFISLVVMSGCSDADHNVSAPAGTNTLPPAGTYTLTLSGSNSSLAQPSTTTVSVTVTN